MVEERHYHERTEVRCGKYTFDISTTETHLVELTDWGKIPSNCLTQIVYIKDIDSVLKPDRNLIGQFFYRQIDTSYEPKTYASIAHQNLVKKMTYAPWRYLRKIKNKFYKKF